MAEGHYELLLAFDSDDPEFARGFESGTLYAETEFMITTFANEFSRPIHTSNAEMAMRIAETFNVDFCSEDLDDNFVNVIFTRRGQHND